MNATTATPPSEVQHLDAGTYTGRNIPGGVVSAPTLTVPAAMVGPWSDLADVGFEVVGYQWRTVVIDIDGIEYTYPINLLTVVDHPQKGH